LPDVGAPEAVLAQCLQALETQEIDVFAASPVISSAPVGPSLRRYSNAVAVVATMKEPPALLKQLQAIETYFGRVRRGQRWQARTLDIDIIMWSGGIWTSEAPRLAIPHPHFRSRNFVLAPALSIAADWRDPLTGFTIRQLFHRLNRAKPLDRSIKRL
jgi:2-amino-4-hydroxy-6-hydroxymethyldihydropteridine diphosphokinase